MMTLFDLMIYSFVFSTYQQYFSHKTVANIIDYENLKLSWRPSRAYTSSKSWKTVFACKGGSLFLFCNPICIKRYISFTVLSGVHMYIPIRLPKNEIETLTLTLTCKKLTWVPKWKKSIPYHSRLKLGRRFSGPQ